jgi:hypothetical protein
VFEITTRISIYFLSNMKQYLSLLQFTLEIIMPLTFTPWQHSTLTFLQFAAWNQLLLRFFVRIRERMRSSLHFLAQITLSPCQFATADSHKDRSLKIFYAIWEEIKKGDWAENKKINKLWAVHYITKNSDAFFYESLLGYYSIASKRNSYK